MANKTTRKLALKKETLRTLNAEQLNRIVGGAYSGQYCTVAEQSGKCGSTDIDRPTIDQYTRPIIVISG